MRQVEIVASFDDNYAQHAAVMLVSVLKHTSRKVNFHFLISKLQSRNIAIFEKLAQDYGSTASFHQVDERAFANVVLGDLVVQTYFRLLIPIIFSGKSRILYLDVDTVVTGDVGELFDLDLEGETIAAVADPGVSPEFIRKVSFDKHKYFNAGVAVMAVDRMSPAQSEAWLRHAQDEHAKITYHDQCVLNYFLGFKKIAPRYNLLSQFLLPYENLDNHEYSEQEIEAAKASPVVIHYNASFGKPWGRHCTHPLKNVYLYYLLFTPWRWKIFGIVLTQMRSSLSYWLRHSIRRTDR